MSEMVERVAARMWRAETEDAGAPPSLTVSRTLEAFTEQSDELRARWFKFARAALKEIRAPTQGMMVAGGLKAETLMFEDGSSGVIFKDMGEVFTAMLDAALAEDNPS